MPETRGDWPRQTTANELTLLLGWGWGEKQGLVLKRMWGQKTALGAHLRSGQVLRSLYKAGPLKSCTLGKRANLRKNAHLACLTSKPVCFSLRIQSSQLSIAWFGMSIYWTGMVQKLPTLSNDINTEHSLVILLGDKQKGKSFEAMLPRPRLQQALLEEKIKEPTTLRVSS